MASGGETRCATRKAACSNTRATETPEALEIQAMLAGMLKDGSLQAPNANMICVVYLEQGLHSTLGSMIAATAAGHGAMRRSRAINTAATCVQR